MGFQGMHKFYAQFLPQKSHFTLGYSALIIFVGFKTFLIKNYPLKVNLMIHYECPQSPCLWKKEKNKRTLRQWPPGTIRVVLISPEAFCFLIAFQLSDSSNFFITRGCSAFQEFRYGRGCLYPQSNIPSHSTLHNPLSRLGLQIRLEEEQVEGEQCKDSDLVCNGGSSMHRLSNSSPFSSVFSLHFYAFRLQLIFMLIFELLILVLS